MIALLLATSTSLAADDAEPKENRAVGGSMAGWGDVPVATDDERNGGMTHLWAQIQVWGTVWDQDVDAQADPATYGDPEADPGFALNRARFGMDGFVAMRNLPGRHQVDYAIALGLAAPYDVLTAEDTDVQLVDGFGRWALPTDMGTTSLSVGMQRVPFGRENNISSATIPFQESGVASNWMAPSRGVGVVAGQSLRFGEGEQPVTVLARVGGFQPGDPFGTDGPQMLFDGRLELSIGDTYTTWNKDLKSALGVGGAALVRTEPGTTVSSVEGDLLARYKVVTLVGEVMASTISPVDTDIQQPGVVEQTHQLGWTAMLSGWIPVKKASGIEPAVRLSSFDDATALESSGDVMILHGGATWRNLLPRTDLGAGYVHRAELHTEVPNDTVRLWVQVRPDARL
ncbi:MAG: hypothetical protein KC621_11190 [Myxococcales bacterium]|nr:hypothetical protein [Myxococcales bacterium]